MGKKASHTSPSAFDHFAGQPQGLFVAVSFIHIYLEWAFLIEWVGSFCERVGD